MCMRGCQERVVTKPPTWPKLVEDSKLFPSCKPMPWSEPDNKTSRRLGAMCGINTASRSWGIKDTCGYREIHSS